MQTFLKKTLFVIILIYVSGCDEESIEKLREIRLNQVNRFFDFFKHLISSREEQDETTMLGGSANDNFREEWRLCEGSSDFLLLEFELGAASLLLYDIDELEHLVLYRRNAESLENVRKMIEDYNYIELYRMKRHAATMTFDDYMLQKFKQLREMLFTQRLDTILNNVALIEFYVNLVNPNTGITRLSMWVRPNYKHIADGIWKSIQDFSGDNVEYNS